ncbi:MAG: aromatic ring-hydroxylating dioxygenase subunit alpha [Deltaproteobacteria bacterium]|nr:MAG: aromatic ring-hydroxylating dioxygenase subunit alpha [Deltaproteobacteria bacterium]
MIRNRWYVVLDANEVKKKPLGVKRFGERMVFWRDSEGHVACQLDRCCHRGAQLSLGRVVGNCIECPFHGWQFNKDGACTLVPSNGSKAKVPKSFQVKSYPVREAYGWIWLFWGEVKEGQDLPAIEYFEAFKDENWSTATYQEEWPVHYTRSVENQLDVTHLAFTHKKTIGNINKPIVDGPVYIWLDDNTMRFHPVMKKDNGDTAKKATEITAEQLDGCLEFRFPNIWRLQITEKFQNFAAFVPVDDNTSITYLRLYQKFLTVPVLGQAISKLMMWFNQRVLGEDRPMVISQEPNRSELHMEELLVPGDSPIIEFRKRRQQLLAANQSGETPPTIKGRTNASPQLLRDLGLEHLLEPSHAKPATPEPQKQSHAA